MMDMTMTTALYPAGSVAVCEWPVHAYLNTCTLLDKRCVSHVGRAPD